MHLLPRRTPAVIATATTLAAGSMLVPAIPTASAVNPAAPITSQAHLGEPLGFLDAMTTMTTEDLQVALAELTPEEIGDLLVAADPDQLPRLLAALPDADTNAREGLIAGVTTVLTDPVTDITDPITDPITDITDPITNPVTDPITDPITNPVTDPITDITDPITDPLTPDPTPTDPTAPTTEVPPVSSIFDLIPSTGKFTAKLGLARATIMRSDRQLDVLAPITARASGRVNVNLFAARRHHRFTAPVDSANGRVRFKESIPKAQADLGTGIMTIDYAGDDDTRPQSVRLRAASRPAALDLERPTLIDGRLKASGTVTSKARGVVRTELQYLVLGQTKTLKFKAKIKDGKWQLDQKLPDTALGEIAYRTGSVHSYTLFTGYFPERIRGEMRSYQVLGDRP